MRTTRRFGAVLAIGRWGWQRDVSGGEDENPAGGDTGRNAVVPDTEEPSVGDQVRMTMSLRHALVYRAEDGSLVG